jgi:hypothetical protein
MAVKTGKLVKVKLMEGKSQDFVITWFVQEKVLLYQTHPQQS